jgi:phospho-N-acetylmuramoyl-pentapeptide-transferase
MVDYYVLYVCMAGSVFGFLWYNCHPAQIFMGDTGSLALGGLLAYVSLMMKAEFMLLVVGGVFFIEELTVAMQIASFRLTKKRIFPITPIHHYFQVNLKWPEQKIVARAWMLGGVFAVLGLILMRVF